MNGRKLATQRHRAALRKGGILAVILAGHLAVLVLLLRTPEHAPRLEGPIELGLVRGASSPFARSARASAQPPTPPDAAPPTPPEPSSQAPPPPLPQTPLEPDLIGKPRLPSTDPTREPTEIDPAAAAALQERIAQAGPPAPASEESQCGVTERMQDALRNDPALREALARIPRQDRSVANAVSLWNGRWSEASELGGEALLARIRELFTGHLVGLAPACLSLTLAGPRLLLVPDGRGPTVIAVGSGLWRWSDLSR